MNKDILTLVGVVALVIAVIVFGPLIVIWALNTLFNLSIVYSFWTWLSCLILLTALNSRVSKKS